MNESHASTILEKALGASDADAVVAGLNGGVSATTRLADNLITQNSESYRAALTVNCAYGQSHGTASTEDLGDESIKAAVKSAQAIAKSMPPDPEYMPPLEPAETAKYPKVDGFHEQTAQFTPTEKASQLAAAAAKVGAGGYRLSGAYTSGTEFAAVANSAGLKAYHTSTQGEVHLTAIGDSGSGWAERISGNVADIAVDDVAARALSIAEMAQNPADGEPGKYTVIMRPAAVAEMLVFLFWGGFEAKAVDEERTFLRGKLGTKVCGDRITLRSDPSDTRCQGQPFQDEGLASPVLSWIQHGTLRNLSYSRFWAKKQGKEATGFPSNLVMEGGDSSVDEMIAATERGLLITRFWYIRFVDPMAPLVTGMTRDGLFRIENGKVAGAVKHMRFNDNPLEMLNRVEAMGPPERTGEWMPMLIPTIKLRDFNFTSTTRF